MRRLQRPDPDEAAIATLERQIVEAHDQRMAFYDVAADEAERLRPGVVALAATVAERLRHEHRARTSR